MVGQRTSETLQVKIAGGWSSLTWERRIAPVLWARTVSMATSGMSQRAIAGHINAQGLGALGTGRHRGHVIRVLRQAAQRATCGLLRARSASTRASLPDWSEFLRTCARGAASGWHPG